MRGKGVVEFAAPAASKDDAVARRQRPIVAGLCGALIVAVFAAFSPALSNGFINLDDGIYIVDNPMVQRGLGGPFLQWAFTTTTAANWHPLTWISHAVDWSLFNAQAGGHHAVNLVLHAANACLVLLVLARMTGSAWRSAVVAAIFALHPLRVESVAWAAERKDVLSTLFGMLALLAYAGYVRRGGIGRYVAVTVCFALSLLSKPMLVTLPFVFLLLDIWPLRRWRWNTNDQPASISHQSSTGVTRGIVEKLPWFLMAAAVCVTTVWAQRSGHAVVSMEHVSLGDRLANAVVAYGAYLWKTLWPTNLAVFYPHPGHWPAATIAGAAVALLGLTVVALWSRQWPVIVGWLWFLGTLVPVIGLVQVGAQAYADRYTYVPGIGLLIMLAWGVPWGRLGIASPRALSAAGVIACCVLGVLTFRQSQHWHSAQSIMQHTLRVTNNSSAFAHLLLGAAMLKDGDAAGAADHAGAALQLNPTFVARHDSYGAALVKAERLDEAFVHFQRVCEASPNEPRPIVQLGIVLAMQSRAADAERLFRRALEMDDRDSEAWKHLGAVLVSQDRTAEAAQAIERSLALDARDADAWLNLGLAQLKGREPARALESLKRARRLDPGDPEILRNLGVAHAMLGEFDHAEAAFMELIHVQPNDERAQAMLNTVRAQRTGGGR